mmetsp:Transcript_27442/g.93705  ORF Transcript_27442/g.93705 Transcript_27442/m.93705 type:complete len:217 (+) Transcript_27442:520-1170(+)
MPYDSSPLWNSSNSMNPEPSVSNCVNMRSMRLPLTLSLVIFALRRRRMFFSSCSRARSSSARFTAAYLRSRSTWLRSTMRGGGAAGVGARGGLRRLSTSKSITGVMPVARTASACESLYCERVWKKRSSPITMWERLLAPLANALLGRVANDGLRSSIRLTFLNVVVGLLHGSRDGCGTGIFDDGSISLEPFTIALYCACMGVTPMTSYMPLTWPV